MTAPTKTAESYIEQFGLTPTDNLVLALEAAIAQARAETIEECAKRVDDFEVGARASITDSYGDCWGLVADELLRAADAVRALAGRGGA